MISLLYLLKRIYMKLLLSLVLCSSIGFASLNSINSFKADFIQSVTDDKNSTLLYSGNLAAQKPQNALWHYISPIEKDVYINKYSVTIIEPEIEQVIIRKIETKFDFFNMIQNAKKVALNTYQAQYQNKKFTIKMKNNFIEEILYSDDFENKVSIVFTNQKQNINIEDEKFVAKYPVDFDIIRD